MFKISNLYDVNEELVNHYASNRVLSITDIDTTIFRTDYVRDTFSAMEYCDRLEEIFKNTSKSIGERLGAYLTIENETKRDLIRVGERDRNFLYYHLGYCVASILKTFPEKNKGYGFYDFGVYENDTLYAVYFELVTEVDIQLLGYGSLIAQVLGLQEGTYHFRKSEDIYELVIFKEPYSPSSLGEQFYNTNLHHLDSEGYVFPIILGKDTVNKDVLLDLSKTNSIFICGDSFDDTTNFHDVLIANMLYLYDETELSVVVLDSDDTNLSQEIARAPHAVAYHSHAPFFLEVLEELSREYVQRMKILEATNVATWTELHASLLKSKSVDILRAFPWLVISFPHFTPTLASIQELDTGLYLKFMNLLERLLKGAERLGVKFLFTAETNDVPLESLLTDDFYALCGSKFVFNMERTTAVESFAPSSAIISLNPGEALYYQKGENDKPTRLRPSILGVWDVAKMEHLFRALSLDLHREIELSLAYNSPMLNSILTITERNMENDNMLKSGEPLFRPNTPFSLSIEEMAGLLLSNNFQSEIQASDFDALDFDD